MIVAAVAIAIAAGACGGGTSKSEAERNLEKIGSLLKAKYEQIGAFPTDRAGPTPPITCCSQPEKECGNDPTAWDLPFWKGLGFSVAGKHKFVYTYEGNATGFTVTATGDLDCDGTASTFTLTGTGEGKKVTTKLQKPTLLD
jgi:hypothetical protein